MYRGTKIKKKGTADLLSDTIYEGQKTIEKHL